MLVCGAGGGQRGQQRQAGMAQQAAPQCSAVCWVHGKHLHGTARHRVLSSCSRHVVDDGMPKSVHRWSKKKINLSHRHAPSQALDAVGQVGPSLKSHTCECHYFYLPGRSFQEAMPCAPGPCSWPWPAAAAPAGAGATPAAASPEPLPLPLPLPPPAAPARRRQRAHCPSRPRPAGGAASRGRLRTRRARAQGPTAARRSSASAEATTGCLRGQARGAKCGGQG